MTPILRSSFANVAAAGSAAEGAPEEAPGAGAAEESWAGAAEAEGAGAAGAHPAIPRISIRASKSAKDLFMIESSLSL
jgi:hypothetical protein